VELIRKTVLADAVAVLAVLLTAAGPAAGSTAVRVVPWEGMGWQNMMARPSAVYTGRHAPNGRAYMLFVTWDDWRAASAAGHWYVQLAHGRASTGPGSCSTGFADTAACFTSRG
jgi:hypothetical protein